MTVIMDLFWSLGTKDYNWKQNLNFTQEMRFGFQKATFWRKLKNWLFWNHCLCRLVQSILMKIGTFFQWSFLVIINKSSRTCLNNAGDAVIQSLKSRKTRKIGLVPMWHLFLPSQHKQLKYLQKMTLKLHTWKLGYRKWSNERPLSNKCPSLKSAPPKVSIFEISAHPQ